MAGGIIKALKDAGVAKLPPVTGQDADLDAVQRIVADEQYMSVYKPYPTEAENAARWPWPGSRARTSSSTRWPGTRSTARRRRTSPAQLVSVVALTKDTIQDTVIADGIYKVSDICTAAYKADCAAIGLK